ncbi:MBL fold metallo-hydrolase [Paenibacillus favisporus]|uniref:MBL fold metallo-hydrolase n=1 Tax=Paenibacillus favisporus TaxID=221028 RepID=UPI003B839A60
MPLIQEQKLSGIGISAHDISQIIITHRDLDQIGSLPSVIEHSNHAPEVSASEIENPYNRRRYKACQIIARGHYTSAGFVTG